MINERYPIGKFECDDVISKDQIDQWIKEIRILPEQLKALVENLSDNELDQTYRKNSWNVRQLVHHIADSHANAYIRIKLALTEEIPTIKPYEEAEWAKLPDYNLPIEVSLQLIHAIHKRLVYILQNLTDDQLTKAFNHPDSGLITVGKSIGTYAWHGKHHLAHIKNALAEK